MGPYGDHRPNITGVPGISPAISAASGVAMSRGENWSVPPYSAMSASRHHRIHADVLGGEIVNGQLAARIKARGADEEVVIDHPVVPVRMAGSGDLKGSE